MTYPEALQYFDSFLNYEQTLAYRYPEAFSLERVQDFLRRLGDPQGRYPTLHVAGTKGKGSTCAFAASILQAAGVKTGLYTSPHLFSIRERFQINGTWISEQEMAEVVEQVRRMAPGKELTYFEVTTACAFLHFARANVDAAVVEVGLGGRLDATNVLLPEAAAITPISFDHMDKLGNTLAEIAREKAGILKAGVPTVVAPQWPEAMEVIERVAKEVGAPLHRIEQEVPPKIQVPLLGRHQRINAATAIRLVELSAEKSSVSRIGEEAVRRGIAQTQWPGRCQLIEGTPPFLLDGAQNTESARVLKETVQELFPDRPVCLVVGASADKDLEGIARVWGPWAKQIILTRAEHPRAAPLENLRQAFSPYSGVIQEALSVEEALRFARSKSGLEELVVVSGSLFVVAEAIAHLTSATPSRT